MDWADTLPADITSLPFPGHNRHVATNMDRACPGWRLCAGAGSWPALHLRKSCSSGMCSILESLGAPWTRQRCVSGCASQFHGDFHINREDTREMLSLFFPSCPGFCSGDSFCQHRSSFFLNSMFLILSFLSLRILKPQTYLQGKLGCELGCGELLQALACGCEIDK